MSIVKTISVGKGDMFYIQHGNDNFTIIDCCMDDGNQKEIIAEIKNMSASKGVIRFISTHPDDDHIKGLVYLDNVLNIKNFYCVKNSAIKSYNTDDFKRYCKLRDDLSKVFYIYRGCNRKWINMSSAERGCSGIHILWPIVENEYYRAALDDAKAGQRYNNISCIIQYILEDGPSILWLGDMEDDFMDYIKNDIVLKKTDILFAPHHGRKTGKIPSEWLNIIDPKIVVIGEAPSKDLDYYEGYQTITQNSSGDITFECIIGKVHIYVSNKSYFVAYLENEYRYNSYGNYIGTLKL